MANTLYYKASKEQVYKRRNQLVTAVDKWAGDVNTAFKLIQRLIETPALQGNAAASIKGYMDEIQSGLAVTLQQLLVLYKNKLLIYCDLYYGVDEAENWKFESNEIRTVGANARSLKSNYENIERELSSILTNIKSIISFSRSGDIEELSGKLNAVNDNSGKVDEKICEIESGHFLSDFSDLETLSASLKEALSEAYNSFNVEKIKNYQSMNAAAEIPSIVKAYNDFQPVGKTIQDMEGDLKIVYKHEKIRNEYLEKEAKKREEREQRATYIKIAVGGVCVVGSVVATVCTAGAASPTVAVSVAAVTGAATAVATSVSDDILDTYVEDGNLEYLNYGQTLGHAAVKGTVGAVTGAVGCKAGEFSAATKFFATAGATAAGAVAGDYIDALAEDEEFDLGWSLSKGVVKGVGAGVVGTIKGSKTIGTGEKEALQVITGTVTGTVTDVIDYMENIDDVSDIDNLENTIKASLLKNTVGNVVSVGTKSIFTSEYDLDKSFMGQAVGNTIKGAIEEGIKGGTDRFLGELYNQAKNGTDLSELDYEKAKEEALDVNEILKDTVGGGLKKGLGTYAERDEAVREQRMKDAVQDGANKLTPEQRLQLNKVFSSENMLTTDGEKTVVNVEYEPSDNASDDFYSAKEAAINSKEYNEPQNGRSRDVSAIVTGPGKAQVELTSSKDVTVSYQITGDREADKEAIYEKAARENNVDLSTLKNYEPVAIDYNGPSKSSTIVFVDKDEYKKVRDVHFDGYKQKIVHDEIKL